MLRNILLLFVCIHTINNLLSVPSERRNAIYKTNTSKQTFPRKHPLYRIPFKEIWKGESYYEPYWSNGDWVFYRGTSTQRPNPYILNQGNTTKHDECNQICPQFVQDYGMICGQKYNEKTKMYDYEIFEDYCHMELRNCYSASKRWYPIQKGKCSEPMTTQPEDHISLITRAALFENNFFSGNYT